MSTPGVKQDPESGTPTPAPAPAPTVSVAANMAAGIPVQTYSSPAHAQWAAAASQQMAIDPQLQAQNATTATAAKPAATPQPTPQQAAAQAAYYQAYSHYPQHYAYQYIQTQAAQQHQQQQHHVTTSHNAATVGQRASFSVATTPAPPTPVTASHTPAAVTNTPTTPAATTAYTTTTAYNTAAAQSTAIATTTQANNNSLDTSDVATLNDALGSAGVDLRAEEESLQRHDFHIPTHLQTASSIYMQNRQYEDRSRKQPPKPAFNTQTLATTMRTIGTEYKVTRIPDDTVNYMALALRARLQDLITAMIDASRYRKEGQFDQPASMYEGSTPEAPLPMWSIVVRSDVARQLEVLERVEREEEMRIRRERKERQELAAQHTANLAAQANGTAMMGIESTSAGGMGMGMGGAAMEEDGQPKKKKKKDGPGVTARNLSEDVRKKMSNAVATQAAGLGKYSWMTASAASSPAPKKPAAASTPTPAAGSGSGGSSWARPYVPKKPQAEKAATSTAATATANVEEDSGKITVTMRDAVFVLEKERGHGAGRGAARGWR